MVNLSFILKVKCSIQPIWQYFARFQTTQQWDPNVRKAIPLKITPNYINSQYQLTTVFNENQSTIVYNLTNYDKYQKICLKGKNNMIQAIDQIHFRQKGEITQIQYRANISLRGIYWLFTPCIRSGLDKLTEQAKNGMKKKCQQLFGQVY